MQRGCNWSIVKQSTRKLWYLKKEILWLLECPESITHLQTLIGFYVWLLRGWVGSIMHIGWSKYTDKKWDCEAIYYSHNYLLFPRCEFGVLKNCYGEGDLEVFEGSLDLETDSWRSLPLREAARKINPQNDFHACHCNCKRGCKKVHVHVKREVPHVLLNVTQEINAIQSI